jgi:hypothetical protein
MVLAWTNNCNGFLPAKESRTKMQRGNFHTCLIMMKNKQYKNNKRNVKTYTADLVTTNTETGTITHETLKEYGCLNMVPNQRQR